MQKGYRGVGAVDNLHKKIFYRQFTTDRKEFAMGMKATGIVRRIDHLGRVVIPKELRTVHFIEDGSPLEIFVDDDKIILRKYQPGCILCGQSDNLHLFQGKHIRTPCITKAAENVH